MLTPTTLLFEVGSIRPNVAAPVVRWDSGTMRFLLRLLINAFALWLTTLIVSGVDVVSFEPGDTTATLLTFLLVALIFGVVNSVIGSAIRIVAFPLYILTLGLLAFVVNALLLMLVAWISEQIGFGLVVEGFWWGVVGAIVLGVLSWLISVVVRPVTGPEPRRR